MNITNKDLNLLTEKGIKIPEGTYLPVWEDDEKEIHPALDFINGKVITSQFITFATDKGKSKLLTIIDSEKGFHPITDDEALTKLGYKARYIPNEIENKWSNDSMQHYLNGSCPTVNIGELFNEMKEVMKEYIDLPDERMYDVLVAWALGTYFHPMFNCYPYIFLNAMKRSGKTKLLTYMSCLCFNAKFSLSITPATLFRLIQGNRCTLLMDEEEKLTSKDVGEIRSLLLSGYKKGIKVPRAQESKKKKVFEVKEYDVFSPKMIANINGIEDVLEDRCITLILLRSTRHKVINKEINILDPQWQTIRDKLYINLMKNHENILACYNLLSETISNVVCDVNDVSVDEKNINNDEILKKPCVDLSTLTTQTTLTALTNKIGKIRARDLELWLPLLSIGLATDEQVFNTILDFAVDNVNEKEMDNQIENNDALLIQVLIDNVTKDDYYQVKDLTTKLKLMCGYDENDVEGRWISPKWVGRALKRFRITNKRRVGGGREYRITPEMVKELAMRSKTGLEKYIKKGDAK